VSEVVVDANVATKLIFPENLSDRALALVADSARVGQRLVAPVLLPIEITNVIRRRMRLSRLTLAQATALLDDFLAYPIRLIDLPVLHHRALALTEAHSLGGHDAHYVALAQMLNCEMWTADERILRGVAGRLPFVSWIGDYVPPPSGGTG
jgi:predicted nucleic acid-binding protein